jgi:hypothetical protein
VVTVAAIVLAVIAPIATAGWVRGDRRQPQPLVWDLAAWAAPRLQDEDRVELLLPGDNRSVAFMLRVAIAISPPYRSLTNFGDTPRSDPETLDAIREKGAAFALISCITPKLAASPLGQALKLPVGEAALLATDGTRWRLVGTHAYPTFAAPKRWTTELSPGPFCR